MAGIEMNVALGEGVRRLPIYLLLDCSGSMDGAPIESVRRGVELFEREVREDALARQTVHVGVITFGETVDFSTQGLVSIEDFQPPVLHEMDLPRWAQRCRSCIGRWTLT